MSFFLHGFFLKEHGLTRTRMFIRTRVREVAVTPGKATIKYTASMPQDRPMKGMDGEEHRATGPGSENTSGGWGWRIRTSDT